MLELKRITKVYETAGFKQKALDKNPAVELETPKLSKRLPKYLSLDESVNLLNSIEGKNAKRDSCIITLFLNCGLRLSELVSINFKDIIIFHICINTVEIS